MARLKLFFGRKPAASSNVFNVGCSESLSATETGAATRLAVASAAEALSPSEVPSAALGSTTRAYVSWVRFQTAVARPPIAATRAEALTSAEAASTTGGTTGAAASESCAASDMASAGGGGVAAFAAETLAATSSTSASNAIRVYLYWADIQIPGPAIAAVVAENLSGSDASSTTLAKPANRSEVGSASESLSAQTDGVADSEEAPSLVDAANGIGGATDVVSAEALAAADTSFGQGGVGLAQTDEAAAAVEATGGLAIFPVAVAESLTAAATTDAESAATASEAGAAAETAAAVTDTASAVTENPAATDMASAVMTSALFTVVETPFMIEVADATIGIAPVFPDAARVSSRTKRIGGQLGGLVTTGGSTVSRLD